MSVASQLSNLSKCTLGLSTDCPTAVIATVAYLFATAAGEASLSLIEKDIQFKEAEIAGIQRDTTRWQTLSQCDAALIDSNARTASMLLRMKEQELDALKVEYQVRLALARIEEQIHLAKRLSLELVESEQMAINIQATRNDPNVRIYRNDAIVNADLTFHDALREVYRATLVYEYYSSQSYAEKEQLYLTRTIQFGDYNLENYLRDLENAYYRFEETYGIPDTRVAIISLRDDILAIPRLDDAGAPLSQAARVAQLRERLADPALLDESGYLTLGFSTNFKGLSPLTRNHKLLHLEAEVIGSDVGDTIGRLYVRQLGTSAVHGVHDDRAYYRLPERTAVLNPFFNGNRVFTPEIYRTYRLRDRPFINTAWELVINQRDEQANQDLDLQSLSDVRLYVYYTDFTEL